MFDFKKEEMPIALYLKDRKNVTLDFAGATLKLHGQIQPILLEDCENITVKNCVIEYDRAAHSEAEILEITEDTVRLKFGDAFPYRVDVENKGLIFTSDTWESTSRPSPLFYQPFDKESRLGLGLDLGVTGENFSVPEDWPYSYWHFLAEEDRDTIILHGAHPSGWKVGNIIAIPHEARWLTALTTMNCRNIHIQNFRIINGFSMGLAPFYTENFYVDRLIATYDSRSRGLISNTADLIHAVGCKGDMVIENSVFEGMIEHSTFELPIILTGDASYWYESSPIQDLTIQNCSFTLPRAIIRICPEFIPTPKAPYYHENIKIMNNTFASETPITGGYADKIVFTGNTHCDSKEMHLSLTSCGSCVCDCAMVERITKEKTEMARG